MRVGDVSVVLVAVGGGELIEGGDGRVLARPRQVYAIRLTNHADRRAVVRVSVDGRPVTGGGLLLAAGATETLERPVGEGEHGRFTVFPEGTEEVFGEDGGRDNPDLGLVEAEYRRERESPREPVAIPRPETQPRVREFDLPPAPPPFPPPGTPPVPPSPPAPPTRTPPPGVPWIWSSAVASPAGEAVVRESDVDSAAGTGLTGRSEQVFRAAPVGPLEEHATRVRLRIVIGRPEAWERARP
ncbi:MAG TPA: hypothetical protein VHG51_00790, partial [Longimicrobiaceae bacterium]|nr:hypothetical protein [Longimicrobiaceae bacterium]